MVQIATNTNFKDITAGSKPVLVDFWAVWCGPCRMLSPTVDDIAAEFPDKYTVVKCNVDDCEDIASDFGIRSIPTLLYIKDGEVKDRTVGVVSKEEILSRLDSLV
ncbi:MAG: thioredoxin [Bacteroidales bacterium]|nr:thioredoxin [Bacteroidales bacterium]